MTEVQSGIYRHYKGQHYLVLGLAHDANAEDLYREYFADGPRYSPLGEREVVVYVPLELDGAHAGARLAVRTLSDFTATVCPFNRAVEDGNGWAVVGHEWCGEEACDQHPAWEKVPRFAYVGQRWQP